MRRLNLQLFALTLNTSTSIVDYLKSIGQDSSYTNRQKLASQYGISNYTGTADQNTKLLQMMKNASSASSSNTNTQSGTKNSSNSKNSSKNSLASAIAGITSGIVSKVAENAKNNNSKNNSGSTNVKDASDLLEERQTQTYNSSNQPVSAPLVSDYNTNNTNSESAMAYASSIAKGQIGLYSVPESIRGEVAKILGIDYQEETPTFTPIETPTYTPSTNTNVQSFTPVEMPTYTPTTKPAEQATSLNDRLDQATLDKLNSQFQVSDAYNKAMEYTNGLLQQLNTGKTQYTDQISQLIKDYQNRDKFSYSADSDPLFQQMLSSAMQSGKTAMQDTMGQAAALSGGYASSYAQGVGNNAYNQYIQEAYNNLPEYYQLAMEAYNMEGQNMLNQLSLLDAADSKEYDRMFNAWNTNYQNAQDMYNKEYGAWRDSVADAYNYAGLQNDDYWNTLNYNESVRQNEQNFEYQQYLDKLAQSQWQNEFNYQQYIDQLNQSNADREFEYQQYLDRVAQNQWQNEFNYGQYMDQIAQNQWNDEFNYQKEQDQAAQDRWQSEFDYEKEQDKQAQTNYENEFNYQKEQDKQSQSNWESQFEYGKEQDKIAQGNWEKEFAQSVDEFNKTFGEEQRQFDASLTEDQRQFNESLKEEQRQYDNYVDRQKEIAEFEYELAMKEAQAKAEAEGAEEEEYKSPKEDMFTSALQEAVKGGEGGLVAYCDTVSEYDGFALVNYCDRKLTFTKSKDTINGFWGVDKNDLVTDGYGQTYKIEDVAEALGLSKSQQKKLTKLKEGEIINLLNE